MTTESSRRISILVPIYRTPLNYLAEMIDSVLTQTLESFELILVNDGSDDPTLERALAAAAAADPRIIVRTLAENSGIVAASAAALALAEGEFVALLDHDDILAPTALERVIAATDESAGFGAPVDVLYTDEDQLHPDGEFRTAFRKPDFSPERLRGQMYLGHLTVYRRSLLERIGGFRPGFDGSQDYDLALRATEAASKIIHIPEVLYHWRIHSQSVSQRSDNAPVFEAAKNALTEHLMRSGIVGTVEQVHPVGIYRIHRELLDPPLVSVIIPTRGSRGFTHGADRVMVVDAVRSLVQRTTYPNYEIVVVADTSTPPSVLRDLEVIAGDRLQLVAFSGPFDFSAKMNRGAIAAKGPLFLLLNDDVEILTPDWIETMAALALVDDVGMVGAKLLFEDGTIQHLGHLYERGDVTHVAAGAPADWTGPVGDLLLEREVSGVTAACAMIRRNVYEQVGGLSGALPINFNDVDLSLKITGAGYRILITPFAVLHHFESKTRERSVASHEVLALRRRWDHRLLVDPFWRHDAIEVSAAQSAATAAAFPGRNSRDGP
jgi:GT2 family glycosyltransferase